MSPVTTFIIIILSAFTGWIVIKIALLLVFHPRLPVKIMGFTLQGILPRYQLTISKKTASLVMNELVSFDEIEHTITSTENLEKLRPEIEEHLDHFLRHKLKEVFPMLGRLIGDKTILQLKAAFLLELETLFPILMKSYLNKLKQDNDLEKIITEKLSCYPTEKISAIVKGLVGKQMAKVELLGLGLGLLTGLINLLVIAFAN